MIFAIGVRLSAVRRRFPVCFRFFVLRGARRTRNKAKRTNVGLVRDDGWHDSKSIVVAAVNVSAHVRITATGVYVTR